RACESSHQVNCDQRSEVSGQQNRKKFMSRKIFCLTLCAGLFALCVCVEAQQPKKIPRIGYLSITDPATESSRIRGNPTRSARAGLRRKTEHRGRVPI